MVGLLPACRRSVKTDDQSTRSAGKYDVDDTNGSFGQTRNAESNRIDNPKQYLSDDRPIDQVFFGLTRQGQFVSAGDCLRRAVIKNPADFEARRLLIRFCNAMGDRIEAAEHSDWLLQQGIVDSFELVTMIDRSNPFGVMHDESMTGVDKLTRLDLEILRRSYLGDRAAVDDALQQVKSFRTAFPDSIDAAVFEARILADAGRYDALKVWFDDIPQNTDQHFEYAYVAAVLLKESGDSEAAVDGFVRCLSIDPTHRRALRGLAGVCDLVGNPERAGLLRSRVATLDEIARQSLDTDANGARRIAKQLAEVGRIWESHGWTVLASRMDGTEARVASELLQRQQSISAVQHRLGTDRWNHQMLIRLLQFEPPHTEPIAASRLAGYVNRLRTHRESPAYDAASGDQHRTQDESMIAVVDLASKIGLDTSWISGFPASGGRVANHQTLGGGLAVTDVDRDGYADLIHAQAGGDPETPNSSLPNQIFRNLAGQRFVEITDPALIGDRGYTQGICIADLNQDGWPDACFANIGSNQIYINQGDGTYTQHPLDDRPEAQRWTSHIAAGDLDGDNLPELFEVNYINDPLVYKTFCELEDVSCVPNKFRPAADHVYRINETGSIRPVEIAEGIGDLPGYGFTPIIANFDAINGNDVFIANDVGSNRFWVSHRREIGLADRSAVFGLTESAAIRGCGVGTDGLFQACMGVAPGDLDGDGNLDLHVTNFYREPVNLYAGNGHGQFNDTAIRSGLSESSRDVLGFGTVAIDLDNDGWLDLAVMNGHIFDDRKHAVPYRMPGQIFRGGPAGFAIVTDDSISDFVRDGLGRTIARFDYDRDGRVDMVTNFLDRPTAVFHNESASAGSWLDLELVGTDSERDAIGACVTLTCNHGVSTNDPAASDRAAGDRPRVAWRIGGDGLMASHEPILHFGGLPDAEIRIEVKWPSGMITTNNELRAGNRYLCIEGQQTVWRVSTN